MTTGGFSGPTCREMRQLLGVYVVGAIDPAERVLVDEHLAECQSCRDELAGLAGLPAMLSRVPAADVERISLPAISLPDAAEPSDELLDGLLSRVSAKRKNRMWRGVAAVAAAAVVAAAGATAASELSGPAPVVEHVATASGANDVAAVVDYSPTGWGTAMRVQVSGVKPGTTCHFWVVAKDGKSEYAGTWTVAGDYGPGYGDKAWYAASSQLATDSVRSFQITSGTSVLLNIPAS